MNLRDNPIVQVPFAIAKGVRKNTGVLHFNVTVSDVMSRDVRTYAFRREIWILNPSPVAEWLVANGQYLSGDMKVYLPTLALEGALGAQAQDDPVVTVNGVRKTLAELRPMNPRNGGVDAGADILEFGDTHYRILQLFPENIWRNVPARFKAVLRRAPDTTAARL